METLLKLIPGDVLALFLPMIALKVGSWLKNKDTNETGMDDAAGNILIAAAPALAAIGDGQETAFRKALKVLYTTIGNYLGYPPPPAG